LNRCGSSFQTKRWNSHNTTKTKIRKTKTAKETAITTDLNVEPLTSSSGAHHHSADILPLGHRLNPSDDNDAEYSRHGAATAGRETGDRVVQ
jgi:hypothetical protein